MNSEQAGRDEQLWLISNNPDSPHVDPQRWGPRLMRILDDQVQAARSLAALAMAQADAIAEGNLEALSSVLAAREPVVKSLTESSAHIEPFVRNLGGVGGVMASIPPGLRLGLESRLRELDELLAEVGRRDEEDTKTLIGRRESLGAQLADLSGARVAVAAYGKAATGHQPTTPAPSFQDREG